MGFVIISNNIEYHELYLSKQSHASTKMLGVGMPLHKHTEKQLLVKHSLQRSGCEHLQDLI